MNLRNGAYFESAVWSNGAEGESGNSHEGTD